MTKANQPVQRFLAMTSATILLLAAVWWAREVVIPLVLAVLVTFVLAPSVNAMQRLGFRRVPAVLLVVVLALLVVGMFAVTLVNQATRLANDLPLYQDRIATKIDRLQHATQAGWLDDISEALRNVTQRLQRNARPAHPSATEPVVVEVRPPMYPLIQSAASSVLALLLQAGLVLILVIFMLGHREDLRNRLIRLWAHGNIAGMTKALDDVSQRLSRFLLVQLSINIGFGVAVGVGLVVIGWIFAGESFPYALVAGIIAAVLRYLPYLGAWIATIFPVLVALAVYPQWAPLLWILGLIAALELFIGNFLEPWSYGHSIGVSEVALLVTAAFWAWLWGPVGLVLAPPMTVCLAVAGRFIPQLEFLDIVLSNRPALPTHLTFFQRLVARDQDEATDLIEQYVREHPERDVGDDILLPAVLLTERGLRQGQLSQEESQALFHATREIIDEVSMLRAPSTGEPAEGTPMLIYGVPARDEADALILQMLAQSLPPRKCVFTTVSPKTLTSELVEQVRRDQPAIVCLGVLPINRLAHARYLCHRLREQFAALRILVIYADPGEVHGNVRERLLAAGADDVVGSIQLARNWLTARLTTVAVPLEPATQDSAA